MKKILLFTLLFGCLNLMALQKPYEMKYFVNVGGNFKGVLMFKNQKENTKITYYNISTLDKIPFYAKTKTFAFTKLNGNETLKHIAVTSHSNKLVYDLKKLSTEQLEEVDIAQDDIKNSVIIYDKESTPTDVLEKRLVHSVESLMVYLFEQNTIPTQPFYLYEPHKNMLIKVVFTKSSKQQLQIGSKKCTVDTYILSIKGRSKKLLRVYFNKYPLQVEAYSKKWSYTLAGVGQPKEVRISAKKIVFSMAKAKITKQYGDLNPTISSQKLKKDVFDTLYVTDFSLKKKLENAEIEANLQNYLDSSSSVEFSNSATGAFALEVSKENIIQTLSKTYEVDGEHYYETKTKTVAIKDLLNKLAKRKGCKVTNYKEGGMLCKGEEESDDFDDYLEEYYKGVYDDFEIDDFTILTDSFDKPSKLHYKLKVEKKITKKVLDSYAKKAIQQHYNIQLAKSIKPHKVGESWVVYVKKDAVAKYTCRAALRDFKVDYSNNECRAKGQVVYKQDKVQTLMDSYLKKHYKDIFVLKEKVEYDKGVLHFNYLDGMKKVENGCR